MTDYQIQATTRRCVVTGEEFRAGDRFYSVLMEEAGRFVRKDYSEKGWNGPPEGYLGFWKTRLAGATTPRRPPVDDEMLMDCFLRLEGQSEANRVAFRYVLALLLIRRKRLRLEDTTREGPHEVLLVRCLRKGDRYRVMEPGLSDLELEAVQDDVFQLLGWH
ncbi:MAG: hypothetical protein U0840_25255 [Gemmataceae bacterium]